MSNLKVRDDLKQRQLLSSEWTTTLPSLAPSSDAVIKDDDNLHLITFGSCGAFIHGLEDEYLEVRKEAVDSLCELAANRPELAAKSIDFLVDMFNDEIEIVRLRAILALKRVSHYVLLGDDQADIVLSVIEVLSDFSYFLLIFKRFDTHQTLFISRTVRVT
jgi:integrator complex subunit 4